MGADDKSPAREGASQYTAMGYRLLYLRPTVIVSLLLVLLVVVTGAAGSLIAPHDPEHVNPQNWKLPPFWVAPATTLKQVVKQPEAGKGHLQVSLEEAQEIDPDVTMGDVVEVIVREGGSTEHLLGTDRLGRDVLSRVVTSLSIYPYIGLVGAILGLLAAWLSVIVRSVRGAPISHDMPRPLLGVPFYGLAVLTYVIGVFLSITVVASVEVSFETTLVSAGVFSSLLPMALVHGSVPGDGSSSGPVRLAVKGGIALFPIGFSLALLMGLFIEFTLSFLGVGVPPPTPSLGGMVSEVRADFITSAMWTWVFSLGIALVAVWAFLAIAIPVGRLLPSPGEIALPGRIGTPAGFWLRSAAEIIDLLAFLTVLFVIAIVSQAASAILAFAFLAVLVWILVASPGKRALGLRVLRTNGSGVGLGRRFCRSSLAWVFSAVFLNLMIAFQKDKRGLQDLICDTVVVRLRAR